MVVVTVTDLVRIAVAQHEVRRLDVSVHVLVLMEVLQNVQLNKAEKCNQTLLC